MSDPASTGSVLRGPYLALNLNAQLTPTQLVQQPHALHSPLPRLTGQKTTDSFFCVCVCVFSINFIFYLYKFYLIFVGVFPEHPVEYSVTLERSDMKCWTKKPKTRTFVFTNRKVGSSCHPRLILSVLPVS